MQVRLPVPDMPSRGDEIAQYADMSFDVGLASSDWACDTVSSLSARKGHQEPEVVPRHLSLRRETSARKIRAVAP